MTAAHRSAAMASGTPRSPAARPLFRCALAAALIALPACAGTAFLSTRNAPGVVDLDDPLPRSTVDPGLRLARLSLRGLTGGGVALGGGRSARGSFANGAEANFSLGDEGSGWIARDSFILGLPDRMYSARAIGVTAGFLPVLEDELPARAFVEVELDRSPFGFGAGFVFEPRGPGKGLQGTAALGPVFLRTQWLDGRGASCILGLDLDLTVALLWSR